VRTSSGVFSHTYSFTRPIQVTEPGDYKLSFYNFFNCVNAVCNNVNDTMSIKLREGTTGVFKEVYLGGTNYGRLKDDRWVKEVVALQLTNADYYVSF